MSTAFKFINKKILLISPEPWHHIFVSKHHYAIQLGNSGNSVYFLNPPSKSLIVRKSEHANVFIVDYKGFPKGLRFYPQFLQKIIKKQIYNKLQKKCDTTFDIVWSFDNSVFFDFRALPDYVVKISHIVDYNQHFQFGRATSTADICFTTSEAIKAKLLKFNPKVFKINHGFASQQLNESVVLPGRNRTKALYVGNLDIPYLDWVILLNTATKNGNVDFVFIGPRSKNNKYIDQLLVSPNVFFLPKIASEMIFSYLMAADLLFICYDSDHFKLQLSNPHKMMEYLSSGKPIVATYTEEYADMDDLIVMRKSNKEWPDLFSNVVQNLSYFKTPELSKQRIDFALENTYEKQIERIERLLEAHVNKD